LITHTAKKGHIKIDCWYYCWYRDIYRRAKPVTVRCLAVSLLPSIGVTLNNQTLDHQSISPLKLFTVNLIY